MEEEGKEEEEQPELWGTHPPEAQSSLELFVFLVTLVQKCETLIKTPIFGRKIIGFFGVFYTFECF